MNTTGPGVKVSPRYTGDQEIAYVAIFGDKQGLQFTSNRNAAAGEIRDPSWSPDGKTMLYHKTFEGGYELVAGLNLGWCIWSREPRL